MLTIILQYLGLSVFVWYLINDVFIRTCGKYVSCKNIPNKQIDVFENSHVLPFYIGVPLRVRIEKFGGNCSIQSMFIFVEWTMIFVFGIVLFICFAIADSANARFFLMIADMLIVISVIIYSSYALLLSNKLLRTDI